MIEYYDFLANTDTTYLQEQATALQFSAIIFSEMIFYFILLRIIVDLDFAPLSVFPKGILFVEFK